MFPSVYKEGKSYFNAIFSYLMWLFRVLRILVRISEQLMLFKIYSGGCPHTLQLNTSTSSPGYVIHKFSYLINVLQIEHLIRHPVQYLLHLYPDFIVPSLLNLNVLKCWNLHFDTVTTIHTVCHTTKCNISEDRDFRTFSAKVFTFHSYRSIFMVSRTPPLHTCCPP
jgi:hypothetical protein